MLASLCRESHLVPRVDHPSTDGLAVDRAAAKAPEPAPAPRGPRTASVIEAGSWRGVSKKPSSGVMTRRWKKYQKVRISYAIT